jgi:hypothetical protein
MNNFSAPHRGVLPTAASLTEGFRISASRVIALPESAKLHFWEVGDIKSVIIVREESRKFTGIKMRPGTLRAAVREYQRQIDRMIN